MNGCNGVHESGLVYTPSVGACPTKVVTSGVVTLVQIMAGCSNTSGVFKVLAEAPVSLLTVAPLLTGH